MNEDLNNAEKYLEIKPELQNRGDHARAAIYFLASRVALFRRTGMR